MSILNYADLAQTVNNANTVKIIKDMIKSDQIPGAFIFEGENGGDRDLIANVLAKTIVCRDIRHKKEYGEPCGICAACVKSVKNIHPDIIVPGADSDGALSFHIEKVRDIVGSLYLTPNESDKKVYIINNMQNMTPQGQNALLKSLEEPPPFAVFIITVTNCDLILETVKSRAVKFTVDHSDNSGKKGVTAVYDDLIRDILVKNPDKLSAYQKLMSKSFEKSDKTEVLNFYSYLENALRDILIAKIFMPYENTDNTDITAPNISFLYFTDHKNFEELKNLANLYSTKKIFNLAKKIHKYKTDLDYNVNIRLNLVSFLSSLYN